MRTLLAVTAALLATACSAGSDSQPSPASPQASPAPDAAASAPHGRWQITVASESAYYPGGANQQELTIRIVCDDGCVGTIETESGVIRTVRWDGERLRVALPAHETGAAKCFDAQQSPGPGISTMTVDRSGELVLEGSEPDAAGMPTRLVGRYDEEVTIDEQSADCGFPDEFLGTWAWDLTSLDSSPLEDAA